MRKFKIKDLEILDCGTPEFCSSKMKTSVMKAVQKVLHQAACIFSQTRPDDYAFRLDSK